MNIARTDINDIGSAHSLDDPSLRRVDSRENESVQIKSLQNIHDIWSSLDCCVYIYDSERSIPLAPLFANNATRAAGSHVLPKKKRRSLRHWSQTIRYHSNDSGRCDCQLLSDSRVRVSQ